MCGIARFSRLATENAVWRGVLSLYTVRVMFYSSSQKDQPSPVASAHAPSKSSGRALPGTSTFLDAGAAAIAFLAAAGGCRVALAAGCCVLADEAGTAGTAPVLPVL